MSIARLLGEKPPSVLSEMRARRKRTKVWKAKKRAPKLERLIAGQPDWVQGQMLKFRRNRFEARRLNQEPMTTFPPSDFPVQIKHEQIRQERVAASWKVPAPGTLTKSGLRRFIQHNRWDIIGAYFNFAPKFLQLPSRKPIFDWSSCPDAMADLLRTNTPKEMIREVERVRRGTTTNPHRLKTHEQQSGECYYCGEPTEMSDWTLDHKIPISSGGKHRNNRVGCCYNCNKAKGNMTVDEFLATDFLTDARRAVLGFAGAPAVSFQTAKQRHHERLRK